MTNSEIRAFVNCYVRAYERQDIDALVACYTDDCTVESRIFGTVQGRTRLRATFYELFETFTDFSIQINDILIDREQDERAVFLFTSHITQRGVFRGVPGIGSQLEQFGTFILTFRDGRIVSETRSYAFTAMLANIEKARTDYELKVAGEVQRALLPRTCHAGDYFEAVGASLACRAIGGDFFEYVDLPSGDVGVALGDVSGKGPAAALLASMLQGIFSIVAGAEHSPSAILDRMNLELLRRGIESRFATLVLGVLSRNGQFVYSNAGHNPPMLLRAGVVHRLQAGGPPLGLFGDAAFGEEILNLEAGDTVVMYTDGVTEALNAAGDEFGEERLTTVAIMCERTPPKLIDAAFAAVREFCGDAAQADDVTMLAMRFVRGPAEGKRVAV